MSRSDFWSIAATLIVAGVAYFVGGARTAYGCIGLGVAIALYLFATHKKAEPHTPVEYKQNQEVKQVVKQEANPSLKQDFHFNLPAPVTGQPAFPAPVKPKPQHDTQLRDFRLRHGPPIPVPLARFMWEHAIDLSCEYDSLGRQGETTPWFQCLVRFEDANVVQVTPQ
jgi:hypothetical protein